jgi:hypothetical protein
MEALAPEEIVATVYEGLAGLPYFSSDDHVDPLHPAVAALGSQIRSAHALALVELAGHVAPPGDTSPYSSRLRAAISWRSLPVWAAANAHEFRSAVVPVATCANRF